MLSTAAFNALLKTLEEPPAHVIFILATTEIQKVPATILSRCQRYDFTRIGPEDIAQQGGVYRRAGGAGADHRGRGADRPAGRWCHARCAVHSGHLCRRDRQSGRRCGPPDGGRHRPELPVPHLGRHCGAGRAHRAGAAGPIAAAVGGCEAPDRRAHRPLPRPYAGGAARRAEHCSPVCRRRKRPVTSKKGRNWARRRPSGPSAPWATPSNT